MFEDITAEISVARQLRGELDLGQNVLDQVNDAITVFSAEGVMVFANRAYRELWGIDPESSFAQTTILDATRLWQNTCSASPVWGEIRDFVGLKENRTEWWAAVRLKQGSKFAATVSPLPNFATMVSFSAEENAQPRKANALESA